jgi:hypothetical protein
MRNEKSKNLTIVAASKDYLPGLNALLNSMDYWKIDSDVLLISWKLPQEYIKKAQEVFNFNVKVIESEHENQTYGTAYERFKYAVEYGKNYESILLLDADMYFMSDESNLFFDVASKGFIITAANNMLINFNEAYQKQYNVNLGSREYPYVKIHTTAPIWLGSNDLDWFEALYNSERVSTFDDFLYLNILGIKMEKDKKMIVLPSYRLTNIHHFSMKVETGMIKKGNLILSGTEEGMIMNHGKFWDEPYFKDLMTVMDGYLKNEEFSEKHRENVLNSRKIMLEEFIKYSYKCKLDLREFKKIEWLENKLNI